MFLRRFHLDFSGDPFRCALPAIFLGLSIFGLSAAAQQTAAESLPDAPGFSTPFPAADPHAQSPRAGGGTIAGTVTDTNGGIIQGATVTLTREGATGAKVTSIVQSGNDGQFSFSNLPGGVFLVTVTAPHMGTVSSSKITLARGETRYLPQMVLPVIGATTVHVVANEKQIEEQIAEEDVHIEESQRVLGVLPNFYSSFEWNAPPLDSKQKFQLAWRSLIDPTTFAEAAGIAGGEQFENMYPGFGTGAVGYGKRYGAALANTFDSRILGDALFPSLFHEDPRYFYKGTGSKTSRAGYAVGQAVLCRGPNKHQQFCYSRILANFTAGAISNLYYPQANRGASLVFENGLIEIGGAAMTNLLREFVLRDLTTHVPRSVFHKHQH